MKVCWNITNKCNANCVHCFRNTEEPTLSLEKQKKILENLKGVVDRISFSGGEVLVCETFNSVLEYANELGFCCSMITNSILLNLQNIDFYIKKLNKITFSLDFMDDQKNELFGRGKNYRKHLEELIYYINTHYPDFPINVNTVVTRENLSDLDKIYNFLKTKNINTWKILRFCPYRNIAKENSRKLDITDGQFEEVKLKAQKYKKVVAEVFDIDEIEKQFVISPSGNLVIGQNNEDLTLLPKLYTQNKEVIKTVIKQYNSGTSFLEINLNLYKFFYLAAKAGSISAASKTSYISQPAISKAIKKIETELDITLFSRSLNGVKLTDAGNKLYHYIEIAKNNILTAERSLKEDESFNKGYLKIGTPSHIATFFIFDLVRKFRKTFPNIKISIISRPTKELVELLNMHEIDFIIDSYPLGVGDSRMVVKPLKNIRHCFFYNAQDQSLYKDIKVLADLRDKPLILPVSRSSPRKMLNGICENLGIEFSDVLEIQTSEMIVNAVREKMGVGYVLYDLVEKQIQQGEFNELNIKTPLPEIQLVLGYYPEYLTPVPDHFIKSYILTNAKQ